jgi:programmed cell death 6-interacting protein
MEDIAKLKTNDQSILNEGIDLLKGEKTEDDRARAKYGTERWVREPSEVALSNLYAQSTELQGYMKSAAASDELVQTKVRDSEHILRILTGTNRDLESHVPSSRRVALTPQIELESTRLRTCLNEVSRLETRRKRTIESLREKAQKDDISEFILTSDVPP